MRSVPQARGGLSEFGKIDLLLIINNAAVRPDRFVEGYGCETTSADV